MCYTTEENRLVLRRYWTTVCQSCAIKPTCTTGKERRITRWEHEHVLEAVQRRLDEHPEKMRQRRETVEHPFGTIIANRACLKQAIRDCEQRSSNSRGYGCAISRNRRWPCGLKNGSGAMAAVLRRRQSWRWRASCW